MKKLEMNEMERIEGGKMDCADFIEVLEWLYDNGHDEQAAVIIDAYGSQYC